MSTDAKENPGATEPAVRARFQPRALLLDIQGVLIDGGEPIAGAIESLQRLRDDGLDMRFLTNVTTRPRRAIVELLVAAGFALSDGDVFSPTLAANIALRKRGFRRVHLAAASVLAEDFADFDLVSSGAEAVVLGDLYRDFSWEELNRIFTLLQAGGELVALHKNRYCRRDGELALDLGPFVAALEYACGRPAMVVGKPARPFFQLALEDLGLRADEVVMVGDDLEADVGGARAAGIVGIQVRTGKFRAEDEDHPVIQPDARIASIAALPDLLTPPPTAAGDTSRPVRRNR